MKEAAVLYITMYFCSILAEAQVNFDFDKTDSSNLQTLNFRFKNINQIDYYEDGVKLKVLSELEGSKDWIQLYDKLGEYVKNFGIGNFRKDTDLLWKLAKVATIVGEEHIATFLHQLVLRHYHPPNYLGDIKSYRDSLNYQKISQYASFEQNFERFWQIDSLSPTHGKFLNLGDNINSSMAPDYAPNYNPQNKTLIFTSQRLAPGFLHQNTVNEDIYISSRDTHANWTKASKFDNINTRYNEGSGCLSPNGKTLYFSRCNSPDSFGNCDLFVAHLQTDSTWGDIKNLGEKVNSSHWDSHPTLSHGEDTLYFASDRMGGFGMADIYFTYRDEEGNWTTPKNMGPVINTSNNDVSPFYHPVFDVLYFSSAGQPSGFGAFDIYKTQKNVNHLWEDPVCTGPSVNHRGSEMYFTLDPQTNLMFFARSAGRDLTKQDLYSFPLPMEAHPQATVSFRGSLTDSLTEIPLNGMVAIIDLDEGIEVSPKFIKSDGTFEFDLIDKRNYAIIIRGKKFFQIEEQFFLSGPTTLKKKVVPIENTITFASVNFDFDSATLKGVMHPDLNKLVKFMQANPEFHLKIAGHTDSEGSYEYNMALSLSRAENIRAYMLDAGISETRIDSEGFGNTQPVVEEISRKHQAANRRVEFVLHQSNNEEVQIESLTSVF